MKIKFSLSKPLHYFLFVLIFSGLVSFLYRSLFLGYYYDTHFSEFSLSNLFFSLFFGLRFDFSLAAYIAFPLSLVYFVSPRKYIEKLKWLSLAFLLLQSAVLISDLMYFRESSRHLSYEIKEAASHSAWSLLVTAWEQHSFILLLSCFIQGLIVFTLLRLHPKTKESFSFLQAGNFVLCIVLFIPFARGGFQMVPIKPEFAHQLGKPKLSAISLNGAYSALYDSVHSRQLKIYNFPIESSEEMTANIGSLYQMNELPPKNRGDLRKQNIVFILLEGWSSSFMSTYGNSLNTTPEFTKIRQKSLSVTAMLAGGRRTTEGIFNIFCSYPNPLGKSVAQSQLQNFDYQCLPQILSSMGWETSFFQGSLKETSSTGSFAQKTGFSNSYGRDDIPFNLRGRNTWGAHDDDLYDFVIEEAKHSPQPFLFGVNTNSTHDHQSPLHFKNPFPEEHQRLNVLSYADEALGRFVQKFESLYPNTVFIFVADHTTFVSGSLFEQFHIPFAFYSKDIQPKIINSIASQRDIAPSLLDYLNAPEEIYEHFTGVSLFSQNKSFADVFHESYFGWAEGLKFYEYSFSEENNKFRSFQWNLSTNRLEPEAEQAKPSAILRAKKFVRHTQSLLFEGKTKNYSKSHY